MFGNSLDFSVPSKIEMVDGVLYLDGRSSQDHLINFLWLVMSQTPDKQEGDFTPISLSKLKDKVVENYEKVIPNSIEWIDGFLYLNGARDRAEFQNLVMLLLLQFDWERILETA